MIQAELLVFNDIIYTGSPSYTIATFNDALAQHDMIAVMAVVDNVSGGTPTFDLAIEHSCDGRNWLRRSDTLQSSPLVYTTRVGAYSDAAWGVTKQGTSAGGGGGPTLGYVRLAMSMNLGSAHVKVYAVLRNTTAVRAKRKALHL
jgi:hypothetical protein